MNERETRRVEIDSHLLLIGKLLQLAFPQVRPVTVAASAIGAHQQVLALGYRLFPIHLHHWRIPSTANSAVSAYYGYQEKAINNGLS